MTRFGKFFNWLKAFGAELKSPTTSIPIVVCICCLMYIHWYRADPEYGNAATILVSFNPFYYSLSAAGMQAAYDIL